MMTSDSNKINLIFNYKIKFVPNFLTIFNLFLDISSLTLPQSIDLIKKCLADGSSIDSFLAIPPQPTNPLPSMLAARYPDNFKKNRYKDILPYDETRVQLTIEADYINASLVEVCIDPSRKGKNRRIIYSFS